MSDDLIKKILLEISENSAPPASINLESLSSVSPKKAVEIIADMVEKKLVTGIFNNQSAGWPPSFWTQLEITDNGKEFIGK